MATDNAGTAEESVLSLADLTSPLVLKVHEYWQHLRAERTLPAKADFDPAPLRGVLPYLTVEEIHREPLRVRFRLVGTEQARFAAMDYTGRWLHELPWHPDVIVDLLGQYRRLLANAVPIFGASRYAWSDGFEKAFEWALFPMSGPDGGIDYVIGIEDFSMINRDRLERLLERQRGNDRHARPMAGHSPSARPAFF